jgi:hypothetical protein
MNQETDREKLLKKLEQTRRLAASAPDRATKERLAEMVDELEGKLRDSKEE